MRASKMTEEEHMEWRGRKPTFRGRARKKIVKEQHRPGGLETLAAKKVWPEAPIPLAGWGGWGSAEIQVFPRKEWWPQVRWVRNTVAMGSSLQILTTTRGRHYRYTPFYCASQILCCCCCCFLTNWRFMATPHCQIIASIFSNKAFLN